MDRKIRIVCQCINLSSSQEPSKCLFGSNEIITRYTCCYCSVSVFAARHLLWNWDRRGLTLRAEAQAVRTERGEWVSTTQSAECRLIQGKTLQDMALWMLDASYCPPQCPIWCPMSHSHCPEFWYRRTDIANPFRPPPPPPNISTNSSLSPPQSSTPQIWPHKTLSSSGSQKGRPSGWKGFYHCLSKSNIWRRLYPVSNVKHNPSEATKEARVNM